MNQAERETKERRTERRIGNHVIAVAQLSRLMCLLTSARMNPPDLDTS